MSKKHEVRQMLWRLCDAQDSLTYGNCMDKDTEKRRAVRNGTLELVATKIVGLLEALAAAPHPMDQRFIMLYGPWYEGQRQEALDAIQEDKDD